LSPTRELAAQIGESFTNYGKNLRLTNTVIFGGVGQDAQTKAMRRGVDIVVATPGRLLDMMQQGLVPLGNLEVFVLDEADRMLDMGFVHDVKRVIAKLPAKRQSLFFSATMPSDIRALAATILTTPVEVAVTPVASTAEKIVQSLYFVERNDKRSLLEALMKDPAIKRALVFTRTKHGANRVTEHLMKARVGAEAIHGNKSQGARERALANFKSGVTRVLVATDIAARGIDVDGVSHVINFDLPNVAESYVHRIGRTARAGAEGIAFSFCEQDERPYLADIERLIQQHVPRVEEHAYASRLPPPPMTDLQPRYGRRAPMTVPPPRRDSAPSHQARAPRTNNHQPAHHSARQAPHSGARSSDRGRAFGGGTSGGGGASASHAPPARPPITGAPLRSPAPGAAPPRETPPSGASGGSAVNRVGGRKRSWS
jgi:ATP-dependent RNA helicase RhlE